MIHIIGGGLAGCEQPWQGASLGVGVVLHEMRPVRATAVHKTGSPRRARLFQLATRRQAR
jgi:methylenetetrahydrofolate--tRNA-(uracil-5-)-methyltransferase